MGHITKEIIIGILVGAIATASGLFLYLEFISDYTISQTLKKVSQENMLGALLALAALPNLLVFWVFLKKNQDYRARGVLIMTIIIALTSFVLKFL